VAAAALIVLGGAMAWSAFDDDADPSPVIARDPSSTTSTGGEATTTIVALDWNSLPPVGIAVRSLDGPVELYDLGGALVGTTAAPSAALNGPRLVVWPGQLDLEPVDGVEVPPGCSSAEAGGGIRVALCGGQPGLPRRVELIDSAGDATVLVDGLPQPAESTDEVLGHWRWATPSPDGRWVLAQWSGECEVPRAFLIAADSGDLRAVTGERDAAWATAPASSALGWSPDGRGVVSLPEAACGTSAERLGVHLLDPESGALELVLPGRAPSDQAFLWTKQVFANGLERRLLSALRDLGLEECCAEPSHGGAGVTSGAVFEGHDILVNAHPADGAAALLQGATRQRVPLLHGEAAVVDVSTGSPSGSRVVAFACGDVWWWLSWPEQGTTEVDSLLLLAEELVPHLGCTLRDPPDT
jgi:hypothetical protein